MIEEVTPEIVHNVGRAVRDPMIGGWPLIHWEWLFSIDREDVGTTQPRPRGIEVIGAWPDSDNRQVTLRYHPATGNPDHVVHEHEPVVPESA